MNKLVFATYQTELHPYAAGLCCMQLPFWYTVIRVP